VTVELTPNGTRGAGFPKLPRPIAKLFIGLNIVLFRLFGRRLRVMGRPLLLLSTVGAKSGEIRRTTLGWFPGTDGSWLIVASNAGGARHPAWYVNMAKNPDRVRIEVDGRELKVRPESLKGAEREAAWRVVTSLAPGYGEYQRKTDREIPVIRLTAEAQPGAG
jgi:deazaflavin-dependent oxidoreductase (nitroreductase family)